jgi:hypothetical protein
MRMDDHPALARQIDHVYAAFDDAPVIFRFLAETLGLPVVWPYSAHGVFGSGGVCMGNMNFEALQATDDFPTARALDPARIVGIGFEPLSDLDQVTAELDRRAVGHTPLMPYVPEGSTEPFWTNIGIHVTGGTFFCKYHMDVDARRAEMRAELDAADGGALGLVRVAELVVGVTDVGAAAARWQTFLDPLRPDDEHRWRIGDGPAIRLVPSSVDHVEHLVVEVRDLAKAEEVAASLDMRSHLAGLDLRFQAADPQ